MKKALLLLFSLLQAGLAISQNVGVGTTTPTHTFHVVPSPGNDPLRVEGINTYTLERNILITNPSNGIVKEMHIDSLVSLITDSINTDDQNIDSVTLNGTILNVYIENGTSANVDLSSLSSTGTDDQNIDSVTLSGTTLTVYIESGSSANVDLSGLQDGTGTDDQMVDDFSLSGTILSLEIENDGQPAHTVNLSSLQDGTGTDDQNIDSLRLNGYTLTTYIENGVGGSTNLQPLVDSALSMMDTNEWVKGSVYGDGDTVIYARKAKDNSENVRVYNNGNFDVDGHYMKDGSIILTNKPNDVDSANQNLAVGFGALENSIATSQFNAAIGHNALRNNTSGDYNTAVGISAMTSNTTGYDNVAVGQNALRTNTTGYWNSAIGQGSMQQNTSGRNNSAMGFQSLLANTTGNNNTAIGSSTLRINTTGNDNTALGYFTLRNNQTGFGNTGAGVSSIRNNQTGNYNSALGLFSMESNLTGSNNVSIGAFSLRENLSGEDNVAVGIVAMEENLSGSENVANGHSAMQNNSVGNYNVAVGSESLFENSNTSYNTAIGYRAFYGYNLDAGSALSFNPADIQLTSEKIYVPAHGFTIGNTYRFEFTSTGTAPGGIVINDDRYFLISDADSVQLIGDFTTIGTGVHTITPLQGRDITNATIIGANAQPTKSNQVTLGDNAVTEVRTYGSLIPGTDGIQNIGSISERWNDIYALNNVINTSDRRLKKEINDLTYGINKVMSLKPVSYKWKNNENGVRLGFIAQDLNNVIHEVVYEGDDQDKTLGVRYSELIPVLTKAIQEQQELIKKMEERIYLLESQLNKEQTTQQ